MDTKLDMPGMGKAHIMRRLAGVPTKPRWMPLWLHRWRERRAWRKLGVVEVFTLEDMDPSDFIFDPSKPSRPVMPRPWKDRNDESTS